MALETLGVLVNIAGDAGSLVNAVSKATAAFKTFQADSSKVDVTTMPAYKRLQNQIETVGHRMSILQRIEQDHRASIAGVGQELLKTTTKLHEVEAAMAKAVTEGDTIKVEHYKIAQRTLNETLSQQETRLANVSRKWQDYHDKVEAAQGRINKLTIDQGQVKTPEQESKMSRLFALLAAGKSVFNVAGGMLGSLGSIFGGSGKPAFGAQDMVFDKMDASLKQVGSTARGVAPSFSLLAVAMTAGTLAANALMSAGQALVSNITNLGRQAVSSVSDFERMNLSLKSMVAEEIQSKDATLSISDAMEKAGPKAAELVKWVQQLAILSPFSAEQIQQSFMMLKSFGLNADAAQRVTVALTDWASATGRSTSEMQRVSLSLSQVLSMGRLTGEELRELSLVGINATKILSEGFKKSEGDIRSMIEKGAIPAQKAVEMILTNLETKWAGSAAKQAQSFSGLLSSLSDVGQMWLRNFFGPLNEETGKVQGILGAVQSRLAALLDLAGNEKVTDMVKSWGIELGKLADNALTWGQNLVVEFANGMLNGAGAVLDSLNYLGDLLTYWLAPGSPPKFLPNIDKWGEGALEAYMSGWDNLDMSQFNSISGKLESFIKSIGETALDKNSIVPMVVKMREAVAQELEKADNGGSSSSSPIMQVFGQFGQASEAIKKYVDAAFTAARANDVLMKAQKNLSDVTAGYDEKLKGLSDQLEVFNQDDQAKDEDAKLKALQRILTRVSSTDAEKEAARKEINRVNLQKQIRLTENERKVAVDAAQAKVDAAQKEFDAAQKRLEMQEAMLDLRQKDNDLMKEAINLAKEAIAAATGGGIRPGGGGTGITGLGTKPKLTVELPEGLQKLIDKVSELKQKWDDFWKEPGVQKVVRAITYLWNEIRNGTPILDAANIALKSLMTKEDQKRWDAMTEAAGSFMTNVQKLAAEKLPKFTKVWEENFGIISDIASSIFGGVAGGMAKRGKKQTVYEMIVESLTKTFSFTFDILTLIGGIFTRIFNVIRLVVALFAGDWKTVWKSVGDIFKEYKTFFDENFPKLTAIIKVGTDLIVGHAKTIRDAFDTALGKVKEFFDFVRNNNSWTPPEIPPSGNGRAGGGPVSARVPYWVGERGPELFVPKMSGTILSNSDSIKSQMPSSYINNSGGNSQVQNIRNNYLNVNSTTSSQGIVADWSRLTVLGA